MIDWEQCRPWCVSLINQSVRCAIWLRCEMWRRCEMWLRNEISLTCEMWPWFDWDMRCDRDARCDRGVRCDRCEVWPRCEMWPRCEVSSHAPWWRFLIKWPDFLVVNKIPNVIKFLICDQITDMINLSTVIQLGWGLSWQPYVYIGKPSFTRSDASCWDTQPDLFDYRPSRLFAMFMWLATLAVIALFTWLATLAIIALITWLATLAVIALFTWLATWL